MNLKSNTSQKAAQAVALPKATATIRMEPEQVKEATRLLSLGVQEDMEDTAATLMTLRTTFEDGCKGVVKIVNGEAGPWVEAILQNAEGATLAHCDPSHSKVLGTWAFGDVCGKNYEITVEAHEATRSPTGLRGKVAETQAVKTLPTAADLAKADILAMLQKRDVKGNLVDSLVGNLCGDYRDQDALKGDLATKVNYLVDQLGSRSARRDLQGLLIASKVDAAATPAEAKARVKAVLDALELPFTKLTAKTSGFSDLARASALYVKIHGWKPSPALGVVEEAMKGSGIIIQTDSGIS